MRLFAGELSRKDSGFELKLTTRQNGETVDRDVRVLVAHARITNRAGTLVRLPLEDANARVSAILLPRSAWRLDDEGEAVPTLAATRVIITPATSNDHTTETPSTRRTRPRCTTPTLTDRASTPAPHEGRPQRPPLSTPTQNTRGGPFQGV